MPCADHASCDSCLEPGDSSEGCFWCHASGTCEMASIGTEPFGECEDPSYARGMCACAHHTSCGSCAVATNPACVWIGPAELRGSVE